MNTNKAADNFLHLGTISFDDYDEERPLYNDGGVTDRSGSIREVKYGGILGNLGSTSHEDHTNSMEYVSYLEQISSYALKCPSVVRSVFGERFPTRKTIL